jgi:hypothetical protein
MQDLTSGTVAGIAQLLVGHPFDTVKVRKGWDSSSRCCWLVQILYEFGDCWFPTPGLQLQQLWQLIAWQHQACSCSPGDHHHDWWCWSTCTALRPVLQCVAARIIHSCACGTATHTECPMSADLSAVAGQATKPEHSSWFSTIQGPTRCCKAGTCCVPLHEACAWSKGLSSRSPQHTRTMADTAGCCLLLATVSDGRRQLAAA